MSLREYCCITCNRSDADPLNDVRFCTAPGCGVPVCVHCRPDHEALHARKSPDHPIANLPDERFAVIEGWFLGALRERGIVRSPHALYNRPKPGDAREPTEEELVRRIAEDRRIPLDDVWHGINNAFAHARGHGRNVTSFRFCIGFINARLDATREALAGRGPR